MSKFQKVIFSEVKGFITQGGKRAANISIERSCYWHWKGVRQTETVTTNEEGEFFFPAIYGKSLSATFIKHDACINQEVSIYTNHSNKYKVWTHVKDNYDNNGELAGDTINISCELNDKRTKLLSSPQEVSKFAEQTLGELAVSF